MNGSHNFCGICRTIQQHSVMEKIPKITLRIRNVLVFQTPGDTDTRINVEVDEDPSKQKLSVTNGIFRLHRVLTLLSVAYVDMVQQYSVVNSSFWCTENDAWTHLPRQATYTMYKKSWLHHVYFISSMICV